MSQKKGSKGPVERARRLEAERLSRIEERGGKASLEAQGQALSNLEKDRAKMIRVLREVL